MTEQFAADEAFVFTVVDGVSIYTEVDEMVIDIEE